ncbi:MAG: copper amine oxidase N-terminal domain-containing protein [Clostridiaceae bacterium]|nr:copper amine oxidase N-terminal domain-containing protein [Clostridiaceae bacterium]
MKKILLFITVIFIMITLFSTVSTAVEMPLRVVVNGTRLDFPDAKPFIDTYGRTQTPARFIGEALGATVTWDGKEQKAVFVLNGKKLVLYIGKKEYDLDGQKKQMDTAALLQDGRTYVPARYVAEAFGATVRWDSAIRTVYVDVNGKSTSAPTPQTTKDPITGWIEVETNVVDVEYRMSIDWDPDSTILNERYDAAEKMFEEKYGQAIAKEVFQYLRQKQSRTDKLSRRQYKLGNKIVTAEAWDISIMLKVWKEGVVF